MAPIMNDMIQSKDCHTYFFFLGMVMTTTMSLLLVVVMIMLPGGIGVVVGTEDWVDMERDSTGVEHSELHAAQLLLQRRSGCSQPP